MQSEKVLPTGIVKSEGWYKGNVQNLGVLPTDIVKSKWDRVYVQS